MVVMVNSQHASKREEREVPNQAAEVSILSSPFRARNQQAPSARRSSYFFQPGFKKEEEVDKQV